MKTKTSFAEKQQALAEKLKKEPAKVPLQTVTPTEPIPQVSAINNTQATTALKEPLQHIEQGGNKKELCTQVSAWVPTDLLDQVKIKLIKDKKKLTPLIEELFRRYLNE